MAGYSYVDDTDQIELNDETTTWENVLANAQASLELWECLLRTTGGAIEPTKTFWVRILHVWKNGTATLQNPDQTEELWVKISQGILEKIKQINPSTAKRTLGVWQAADGQEDTQTEVLVSKIQDWGENTEGITILSCSKFNIRIETHFQGIPKWTTRDEFMMDYASKALGVKELKTFNKVRLYLNIATISDLAIADGSRVDKQILKGYRGGSPTPSRWAYKWPNIPSPTNKERQSWTAALGTILGTTDSDPSLETKKLSVVSP